MRRNECEKPAIAQFVSILRQNRPDKRRNDFLQCAFPGFRNGPHERAPDDAALSMCEHGLQIFPARNAEPDDDRIAQPSRLQTVKVGDLLRGKTLALACGGGGRDSVQKAPRQRIG